MNYKFVDNIFDYTLHKSFCGTWTLHKYTLNTTRGRYSIKGFRRTSLTNLRNLAGRVENSLNVCGIALFAVGHLGEVGESMTHNLGNPCSEKDSAVRPCFTLPYVLSCSLWAMRNSACDVRLAAPLPNIAVTATHLKQSCEIQQGAAELIAAGEFILSLIWAVNYPNFVTS